MDKIHAHGVSLAAATMAALREIPGVTVYGPPPEERGGIVAFTVDGIHAHDVAGALDREGIAVRAGHHCAMPLHARFGIPASVRASFYVYNTASEVDRLAQGVRTAKKVYGG